MLLLFSILCSFATTAILFFFPLFILTNSCCHSFYLSFCQYHKLLLLPFSLFFVHLQLLLLSSYSSLAMLFATPTLLTSIMCLKLLQGCCNFLSGLHSSLGSLLGLFLYRCCWTKVHTPIFRRVSLYTHLEIAVKSISYLFNCWGWPSYNEIGPLLF